MHSNKTHPHHTPFGSMIENRSWSAGSGYRFGFNGQEKDNELAGAGNSMTAEFWQYDSRLGRRWNVDPKAYLEAGWSAYRALYNNPNYWIDPLGLFEDDYGIDDEGNITLIQETDEVDRLYKVDDSGNKVDINGNGNTDDDYIKINDKQILRGLAKKENGISRVNGFCRSDELLKVFVFAAKNSNVEWAFSRYKDHENKDLYALGTVHFERTGPTSTQLGIEVSNIISSVHNHPKSDTRDNREVESMGYEKERGRTRYSGDTKIYRDIVRGRYPRIKPYPHYVYFPESDNLFKITSNKPSFIRNINGDYRRFNFGVLNHK